MEHVC